MEPIFCGLGIEQLVRKSGFSMAYYSNHNLAYDFILFEEQDKPAPQTRAKREAKSGTPAAKGREKVNTAKASEPKAERRSRVKREKRRKSNFVRMAVSVVAGLVVVFVVAAIIHGQVQLTEINQEIINARAELAEKQSIYTQLEMKVDSSISTAAIEEYAKEKLKMSKASNSQKEFVALSNGDKAEVTLTQDKNIFERIADAIASLWS